MHIQKKLKIKEEFQAVLYFFNFNCVFANIIIEKRDGSNFF